MSTRGYVAYEHEDGSIDFIYNHFDSYIKNGLGDWLQANITDDVMVRDIIAQGDASSIPEGRYYGEGDAGTVDSEEELIEAADGIDYIYLWKNNQWLVKRYDMVGFSDLLI